MSAPIVVDTVAALRAQVRDWRQAGLKVAMVPTMGALHDGHLALVKRAKEEADEVVVYIFVNPKQFGPNEDFAKYPRSFESDVIKELQLPVVPRGRFKGLDATDKEYKLAASPKLFCAGDIRRGQSLVVWAIREAVRQPMRSTSF